MKIRIKDIADRAGVSPGTVDRVIHHRGEVSSKTRERVMGILEEMQYTPDILASSLASRKPFRVAVLIPYHTKENWFWKEPLAGVKEACAELHHFRIEVTEYLYDQFEKSDFIQRCHEVLASLPDALIAAPVYQKETQEFFDRCQATGIPFATINDDIGHPGQMTYVGQDPKRSGAVAGQLMKTGAGGKGKLLVVSIADEKDNYHHIRNREAGFREFWKKESGTIPRIINLNISSDSFADISPSLGKVIQRQDDIRGIYVTNSRVYQVAKFLHMVGREEVFLVGYDLIDPNINYLNSGTIDFLISQKPREQGYRSLVSVFNTLKLNKKPQKEQLISIDIICKENLCCYQI